jgi:N-acetylmuramoyl-L-alanine amidase
MLQITTLKVNNYTRRFAAIPLLMLVSFLFSFTPNSLINGNVQAKDKILVILDPGHSGSDMGCSDGLSKEKMLTLKVAKVIQKLAPSFNVEVLLTRTDDYFVSLDKRIELAIASYTADFISLHINDEKGKENGKGTFSIIINPKNL